MSLLGYANEFGEAFRSHIPRLIYFGSYAVASTYCLADSIDKGRRCYQQSSHLNSYLQKRKAAETAVEAAIWQGLASVIIPGFTINRICAASRFTLRRFVHRMPHGAQMWVTTVIGLSAIPIIIKPIDRFVSMLREFYVKKYYQTWAYTNNSLTICPNDIILRKY